MVLLELRRQGCSLKTISEKIERGINRVHKRAKQLGVAGIVRTEKQIRKDTEIEQKIRDLRQKKVSLRNIAGLLGIPYTTVSRKARNMRISGRMYQYKPWIEQEDVRLEELLEQGHNLETIAEMMGRTYGSIQGRMAQLEICKPLTKSIKYINYFRQGLNNSTVASLMGVKPHSVSTMRMLLRKAGHDIKPQQVFR